MDRVTRIPRKREVTRERLIRAAHEAFTEQGIRDTPVEAICERAGFSRGAFYSNFDSKEDLFLAVYLEYNQERINRLRSVIESIPDGAISASPDLPGALAQISRMFFSDLEPDQQWHLLSVEFRLQGMRQPALRPRIDEAEGVLVEALAEIVRAFCEQRAIRLVVPVEDAVRTLVRLYEMALERSIYAGGPGPELDRHVTRLIPHVLSGLIDPAPLSPA